MNGFYVNTLTSINHIAFTFSQICAY